MECVPPRTLTAASAPEPYKENWDVPEETKEYPVPEAAFRFKAFSCTSASKVMVLGVPVLSNVAVSLPLEFTPIPGTVPLLLVQLAALLQRPAPVFQVPLTPLNAIVSVTLSDKYEMVCVKSGL